MNMLLARAVDDHNWPRVFNLCKEIKERDIAPDATTYTCIMSACSLVGLEKEARATYEDMLASGVKPTRQLFHEMLHVR